jgi:hypothetical protein
MPGSCEDAAQRVVAGETEFFNNTSGVQFLNDELSSISAAGIPLLLQQPTSLEFQIRSVQTEPWQTIKR